MKKFGTPIGAGPGSANENVGFDGVGTPFPELFGLGFGLLGAFDLGFGFAAGFFAGVGCLDGCSTFTGPRARGGPAAVVVVVDWVVVVVDAEVDVVEGVVVDVVDGTVLEVVCGAHDSDTLAIDPVTGSGIDETGVPGGTSTTKLCCVPSARVTVNWHVSAKATGTLASP
jgi:hypothetical protein